MPSSITFFFPEQKISLYNHKDIIRLKRLRWLHGQGNRSCAFEPLQGKWETEPKSPTFWVRALILLPHDKAKEQQYFKRKCQILVHFLQSLIVVLHDKLSKGRIDHLKETHKDLNFCFSRAYT